ncbi:MAG: DUF3109 family protein [Candidatus Hydrogenedentes bacterium]|nr:DUF3109 family protein [Candidatus Hydrogenedentota bacterium]
MNTKTQDRFPLIADVRVDLDALLRLDHACDPKACSAAGCCCGSYEVTVSPKELRRITGMIPESSRFARNLRTANGALENPFERIEKGLYALDTDERGRCVFAYRDKEGFIRCSIHSAALRLGLEPYRTKPFACTLWPLAISEDNPPVLTVQEDAYRFPCNRRRSRPARTRAPEVALIIEQLFGNTFLEELHHALIPHS